MALEHLEVTLNRLAPTHDKEMHKIYRRQTMVSKLSQYEGENPLIELKTVLKVKSEPYDFGKFFIQNPKASAEFTPTKISKSKTEIYNNYERLVAYSQKKVGSQQADSMRKGHRIWRSNHSRCLKSVLEEQKIKMLTEINREQIDKKAVENMLRNDSNRSELFSEAILMDRWVSLEREQLGRRERVKNKKRLDINPEVKAKHLHLQEFQPNEDVFKRRLYVHKCRQASFQQFQSQKLRRREGGNRTVLQNLMKNYSSQMQSVNESRAKRVNQVINKLFLKYASDIGEERQWFTCIDSEGLLSFLHDFELKLDLEEIGNLMKGKQSLNKLDFYQALHMLCRQNDRLSSNIFEFIKNHIVARKEAYLPKACLLFEENKDFIDNLFRSRKVLNKLESVVTQVLTPKAEVVKRLNFDQIVEVAWRLKAYPFLVSKKKLKFLYLYSLVQSDGLSLPEAANILVYVYLSAGEDPRDQILKMVASVLSFRSKVHK